MTNEHLLFQFKQDLEKLNSEIIDHLCKVNLEKGYPQWLEWFGKGHNVVCGTGLTFYLTFLIVNPQKRKQFVRKYAEILKEEIAHSTYKFSDLKAAIEKVFNDLIEEKKAIMFGVRDQFLLYLWRLTDEAYKIVTGDMREGESYRDDVEKIEDGEFKIPLPPTMIRLDQEDTLIDSIDEKRFRDSLDPIKQKIWDDWKQGYSESETEKRRGIDKSKVHRVVKDFKKKV